MTNPNDPAMVTFQECLDATYRVHEQKTGLTKREYFAAMAMQGSIAGRYGSGEIELFRIELPKLANECLAIADALIAELNKKP